MYLQKKKRWYWVLWLYRWQKRPAKPTAYTCLELWLHEIITKSLVRAAILQKQQHYCTHTSHVILGEWKRVCYGYTYVTHLLRPGFIFFSLLCLSGDLWTHTIHSSPSKYQIHSYTRKIVVIFRDVILDYSLWFYKCLHFSCLPTGWR